MKNRGFTLIEMLVVIAIISILIGIGINTFTIAQKKARDAQRQAALADLKKALEAYYIDHGSYPPMPPGPLVWATSAPDEASTNGNHNGGDWIPGLVAGGYISKLPKDPSGGVGIASLTANCVNWKKAYMYMTKDPQSYAVLSHCNIENPASLTTNSPFYDPRRDSGGEKWSWRICANQGCTGEVDGKGY